MRLKTCVIRATGRWRIDLGRTLTPPIPVLALRQGRIQIAFERLLPVDPDIRVELVAREPLFVALPERHALAGGTSVNIRSLANVPLIVNSAPGSRISAKILDLFRANDIEPTVAHENEDLIIAAAMVASGDGVCLVPRSLANLHMPHITYRALKAARGDATMDLYCMTLAGARSPLLTAFRKSIAAPVDNKRTRRTPLLQRTNTPRRSR